MNELQVRQALLVRAFESSSTTAAATANPAWTTDDQAWADAEALRAVGEDATPEQWLQRRAALASQRITQRDPGLAWLLQPDTKHAGWAITALVALAILAGLATDLVGPARQINLLAPPLLAVMVWNLGVYALLLIGAARTLVWPRAETTRAQAAGAGGWLRRTGAALARWIAHRRAPSATSKVAERFLVEWTRTSRPLQFARIATVLHLGALAVVAGALLALYVRGLVFDFSAGWDSTFLGADQVHRWLSVVLAPALAITGQVLPDAAQLESLRFASGGGENASRWIHLYAITAALVMLPRIVLAAASISRSRALQRHFPLPLDGRYFQRALQRLAHLRDHRTHLALVLPYSYHIAAGPERNAALASALDAEFGPGLSLQVLPTVAMGGEDELASDWPQVMIGAAHQVEEIQLLLPLFAMSATPERETHGAFLRTVLARAAALPAKPPCRVCIDESGFRRRLAAGDLAARLDARRMAWQKLLDETASGDALFVDLEPAAAELPA